MNFWWVNLSETLERCIENKSIWSPKTKSDGSRSWTYDNMARISQGDVFFVYSEGLIKAIGVADSRVQARSRPTWQQEPGCPREEAGWMAAVNFTRLRNQINPLNYKDKVKPYLPKKYSPINSAWRGQQDAFLCQISPELADVLSGLIGREASPFPSC